MTDENQALLGIVKQDNFEHGNDPVSIQDSCNKVRSVKKIKLPPIKYDESKLRQSPKSLDMSASNIICKSPLLPLKKLPLKSYHLESEDKQKLKQALNKKHYLLSKLQKIEGNLTNIKNQHRLAESKLTEWQKQKQKNLSPYLKNYNLAKQNISPEKHEKNIELLQKINSQKMQRQERLLKQFKKRTQEQFKQKNLVQLEKIYGVKPKNRLMSPNISKKVQKMNENLGKYPSTIKQQGFGLESTYAKSSLKFQNTLNQQQFPIAHRERQLNFQDK